MNLAMGDGRPAGDPLAALARMTSIVAATTGIDDLVDAVLCGLDEEFGFPCCLLLLHDDVTNTLFTIGSHGYSMQGIGSEVALGVGIIGMAAASREAVRAANLKRMLTYARTVRRTTEEHGVSDLVPEIPLPGLAEPHSQMAVPILSGGVLIGVIAVESAAPIRGYDDTDENVLKIVTDLAGKALVAERALSGELDSDDEVAVTSVAVARPDTTSGHRCLVRHFAADGSTFVDHGYIIRGVAGRLLWKLAREYVDAGRTEFTNREARLDPDLQLPEYRDNFESRLVLLKRRLDERGAALRIVSTTRGRFRLDVDRPLDLERVG